jgi:hypothetical protein
MSPCFCVLAPGHLVFVPDVLRQGSGRFVKGLNVQEECRTNKLTKGQRPARRAGRSPLVLHTERVAGLIIRKT